MGIETCHMQRCRSALVWFCSSNNYHASASKQAESWNARFAAYLKHRADSTDFNGVTQGCASAVHFQGKHVRWQHGSMSDSSSYDILLAGSVGSCQATGTPILENQHHTISTNQAENSSLPSLVATQIVVLCESP